MILRPRRRFLLTIFPPVMPPTHQRTNKSSRSTISVTPRPLLQDIDRDAFFLPGNDNVYLTHSRDGKPALGRKKPNILQDFGFDILGQSLGVPSRKDYERQARPLSLASQSSGLITAPATPRPSQKTQSPNVSRQAYSYEDTKSPVVRRKTSSISSSSTPAPATMVQYSNQDIPNSQQHNAYRTNSSFLGPQASNQHRIPPPPPPPPSAVSWHREPIVNTCIAPIPMSYYGTASHPTYLPGYSYNGAPISLGAQDWANSQHHIVAQYPNSLRVNVPQTAAIPMMPHHQQFSQSQPAQIHYMQAIPTTCPSNIPPPPPPPPPLPPPPQQNWLQTCAMTTRQGAMFRQDVNRVSGAKNIAKQDNLAGNAPRDAIQAHEKFRCSDDVKEYLSKRIRHVHVCAGCGKKRSTRYQKAHPLKRGEIPALSYCYNCLKDAADTDCDSSEGHVVSDRSFKKNHREATVPWPSSDEGHTIADGKYTYKQSRNGPRWVKKPDYFGPLSRLFSRRAPRSSFAPPSRSFSSAEESSSRASSPVSDSCAVYSVHNAPVSQDRRTYERNNNRTIKEGVKAPALPQKRHSSVDSWIAKQNSPLAPVKKKPDRANNEGKVRTATNNKPALARPRTRIPRPRPQPTLVDIDNPFSAETDGSARIPGEERSSLYLDTNGATGMEPMSRLAGMEELSEPLNQIIPNETHKTVKRINTQGDVNEGMKKSGVSSSKAPSPTDSSSSVQSPYLKASMNESLRTPGAVASKSIPKRKPGKSTNHSVHGPRSAMPQIPLDYNPEANMDHAPALHPFSTAENSVRRPVEDNAPVAADEPELFFSYAEPLTPTDAPYAHQTHAPYVVSDSWSDYHIDMEREAEEMAERDLAFAGKLFDSLSGSLGGSATSTFPTTSFATRSNISIVSYHSDSDHSDNDTATISIEGPEVEEVVEKAVERTEANKAIERIEFSSEEEQQNSTKPKTLTEPSIAYLEHKGRCIAELSPSQKKNMYNQLDEGQDDDDGADYPPSPIGSSLIGHTGHSVDELENYTFAREGPATTANGHRLRRFLQLSSA
ncbi:hypothetical protein F4801DRAFT_595818 [Xylaria longipes]|nr:hypothetical protein F4801DRAFT_595818 [Xylaria longipes]